MRQIVIGLFALMMISATVMAAPGMGKAKHVYLVEKDPMTGEHLDGAWAKMMYKDIGDRFVFNGHGLMVGTEYSLISYEEPWNGEGSILLGTDVADEEGNVHIMGELDLVYNYYAPDAEGDYQDMTGAKIWLVPSADFDEGMGFNAWNPEMYLFENNLITN